MQLVSPVEGDAGEVRGAQRRHRWWWVAGQDCPSISSPVLQGYTPRGSVGHEQPAPQVLLALRVEFPQRLELRAHIVGKAVGPVLIELDQVARRIADVELHDVARKQHEMVAKRRAVECSKPLRYAIDGLEVVDRYAEMVVAARL